MTTDPTPQELGWRLSALEKRQEHLDSRMEQIRTELAAGFQAIRSDMKELRLVTKDLYDSEQKAQDDRIESAVKLSMWGLGLMVSVTLAALLGLAIRLASA